jgi:uncharacterized protein
MIARERGLDPLAQTILAQPSNGSPVAEAERFVDATKEVPDREAALAGARDIVAETLAERSEVRSYVRDVFAKDGVVRCKRVKSRTQQPTNF